MDHGARNHWGLRAGGQGARRASSVIRATMGRAAPSHRSSHRAVRSEAGGEGRAGNKFRFIVEMEICVMALKIWFYVCV